MIRWSDAPFNWPAEPELDEKVLNSPQPCSHGSGCRYNGPCAFVHKGEEGTGRRLFPARMVLKDGKEVKQEAAVRLIGSPSFYERRRLRLSWPEWCAKKGIQQHAAPPKATPAFADASGAWPSIVAQAQAQTQPAQAQGKTFASVAAQAQKPLPLLSCMSQGKTPRPEPQEAVFYSYYSNIYQQAIAQHGSIEKALAVACQNMRTASAAAAAVPVPVPTVIPTPVVSPVPVVSPADLRNEYGQKLYDKLTTFKEEMMEFMPNWPVTSTPGMITGMFLDLDTEDWDKLLNDESYFEERVKEALEALEAAAAYKEEAAAARAAN